MDDIRRKAEEFIRNEGFFQCPFCQVPHEHIKITTSGHSVFGFHITKTCGCCSRKWVENFKFESLHYIH